MSKPLAANEFLLNTVRWVESASSPTAGQAGAVGSFWLQGDTYPTTPVASYLKTAPVATGWVRENFVNLGVYNVKNSPYNAVGNGVTDDTAAINAAVTAAAAAGGGTIYFPPGTYRVTKPVSGLGSIILDNKHDLVFLGDGYNSTIAMIGSAGGGDWYMFKVTNGASRIAWYNLHFTGDGITTPDPAQQNHAIQLQGVTADAAGGAHDIDIVGCYFGQFPGDGVRNLGNPSSDVHDVRILYNTFDMAVTTGSRSNVEAQRDSRRITFMFNWCSGSHDQLIDFEPTGGVSSTDGPEEWNIVGNHFDGSGVGGGIMITLSGAGEVGPSQRNFVLYNTLSNGDGIQGVDTINCVLAGNVIISNNTSSNGVMAFIREVTQVYAIGNILISLNATGSKNCFSVAANAGFTPFRCVASENVCRTKAPAGVGPVILNFNGGQGHACNGNIAVGDSVTADKTIGITIASNADLTGDNYQANGNLLLATTQRMRTGVSFGTTTVALHNVQANYNFVDNAPSAVFITRTGAETFLDWRCANNNMVVGGVNTTVEVPATNVGATIEGIAGPGAQQVQNVVTAVGNVTAPVGSMCVNTAGAATTVLFIKESGTGTSGWVSDGASEIAFSTQDTTNATANRFMAPGMAQLTASTVEIKMACPRPGFIRNLRVKQIAGTGAGTISYTFRINAVDKISQGLAFTATVVNVGTSVAVATGDLLSVRISKSAIPATNPTFAVCSFELTS